MKQKFLTFLTEYDALKDFKASLKKKYGASINNLDEYIDRKIELGEEKYLVSSAFHWWKSPRFETEKAAVHYWKAIDNEWHEYLQKVKEHLPEVF